MSEPSRDAGPDEDVPTPRWVYLAGIVVIVTALAFVAMHLSGGIPSHGP